MSALRLFSQMKRKLPIAAIFAGLSFCVVHSAMSAPAQSPLFLAQPVTPIMMLNMSNDHQLFFKAYDDYSDLNGDGNADTGYLNTYDYYGYFDSNKCYVYDGTTNKFNPSTFAVASEGAGKYCNTGSTTNEWSGNFLNWSTMTRIDTVRKILYGGMRSTDTATETVLERAFLPQDAHSFAKYYNGADIHRLTPFGADSARGGITVGANTDASGITICNTTEPTARANLSQADTGAPLMRVARGNYSLWASNERWQCRWGTGTNDNNAALSGINARSGSPTIIDHRLGGTDFIARVSSCVSSELIDSTNNEKCKLYTSNYKPTGLLQEFGEDNSIHFGLLTGSYSLNKSGGVLRKNVGTMTNEINSANGVFIAQTDSIIGTLNRLRIYGYRFDDGTYHSGTGSDNCIWARSSFNDGDCSNWGNPQSEMYLESLRYLAGSTAVFTATDSARITGLETATWTRPVTNTNYCAPLSVLQFNASTSSYDGDQLSGAAIGLTDVSTATNVVGAGEGIHSTARFIGEILGGTGDDINQLCTAKTITNLSNASGTCPDAPRLEGSYQIAGLAYHARKNGIPLSGLTVAADDQTQTVKTYGVALAPAVPKVSVVVPGTGTDANNPTKQITILPACRNRQPNPDANCAIVDFKIVNQTEATISGVLTRSGRLYVNWEDSEQGGDFDQDMWGIINYSITSTTVQVTTDVIAQSSGDAMGFGYVISGTTSDGFHVHSGMNSFVLAGQTAPLGAVINGCSDCKTTDAATTNIYLVGASATLPLEQPLHYAAKWGGYADDDMTTAEIAAVTTPETYFYATDPRDLEASLEAAFTEVSKGVGGAATVAANSTRLDGNTLVYQARFDSSDWSGEMIAYPVTAAGTVNTTAPTWTTHTQMSSSDAGRKIFTYDGATTKSTLEVTLANWNANALPSLKTALKNDGASDVVALKRFNWLRGDRSNESTAGGLRKRSRLLGDIVNSDPAFSGANDMRYSSLPTAYGSASYAAYVETKKTRTAAIFVGANDGMLHAFNANTGAELFSYIPTGVFSKLASLTQPNYQHQYYVDGPMFVGDVYFDNDSDGLDGTWKTVLVGSLGAGGRGIFALDVSNPIEPQVLFDISAGDGSALNNDLGYITGQQLIVPTAANNTGDGVWAVVFGNGYESNNARSKLLAIDIEDPTTTVAVNTQSGTGLSAPALLPNNLGVIADAYAGDLTGKMWRFDLTSTNLTTWGSKFRASGNPAPFFTAINGTGGVQPITAAPTLGYNKLKTKSPGGASSVMVYFGTGKYSESADNATTGIQSFYGIADTDSRVTITAATKNTVLHRKTISAETATNRTLTGDSTPTSGVTTVDWATKSGWYIDLVTPPGAVGTGERIVSKPKLLFDRLLFTSFIPSSQPCKFGGSGWLMELTGVGDKYIGHSILGNMANTALEYGILGSGGLTPIISGEKVLLPLPNIKGEIDSATGNLPPAVRGRMSWRQIR